MEEINIEYNIKNIIKNVFNVLILFLGTELIRIFLQEIPELKNFDVRLIFVLIASSYMGIKYGIFSAILACISYIMQTAESLTISVIFLNTNNWIPMIIYLIFAIIIGNKSNRENLNIVNLQNKVNNLIQEKENNEKKILEYESKIKEFNQLLITNNNSYIQVSKFLNNIQKEKNNIEKINKSLRQALNNSTVALTRIEEINLELNNFLDSTKIKKMKKDKIYINKELKKGVPFYISPVFLENEEDLVLVVWNCTFEQMNNEFKNQIIGITEILKYALLH